MVERLAARARRFDEDGKIVACLGLADEFGEALRSERRFQVVVLAAFGRDEAIGGLVRVLLGPLCGHGATHLPTVLHFAHGLKTGSPAKAKSRTLRVTS